jgi:uncharacterized protein DUF4157
MGRVCKELHEWIEEKIEKPIEAWEERQQTRCRNEPCNWWTLCLNKLFCWLAWLVVKVIRWVVVTVGKWAVRIACEITTFIYDVTVGSLKILIGILSLNPGLIKEGFDDVVSTLAGTTIVIFGTIIGWVQTVFGVQERGRKLTENETRNLRRVFRKSVTYDYIRLIEGSAGVFSINGRAFTLGNVIYMKNHKVTAEPELLVHECTHVWQFQNLGARYSSDAIAAQWFVPDAYNWELEIARGKDQWASFNKEAQAAFLEHLYTTGELIVGEVIPNPKGDGVFYDADGEKSVGLFVFSGVVHTDRANNAVAVVRRGG